MVKRCYNREFLCFENISNMFLKDFFKVFGAFYASMHLGDFSPSPLWKYQEKGLEWVHDVIMNAS